MSSSQAELYTREATQEDPFQNETKEIKEFSNVRPETS